MSESVSGSSGRCGAPSFAISDLRAVSMFRGEAMKGAASAEGGGSGSGADAVDLDSWRGPPPTCSQWYKRRRGAG